MAKEKQYNRLQKLADSDFKMAKQQPDINGWPVMDGDGNNIATVGDLIFDTETRKVRYMEVWTQEKDDQIYTAPSLVPIGLAELNESKDEVIIKGLTEKKLRSLPVYGRGEVDSDYESKIFTAFDGFGERSKSSASEADSYFYDHADFNDENLYSRRTTNKPGSEGMKISVEE